MKILVSPTKKQILNRAYPALSSPSFINESKLLIDGMESIGKDGIKSLLGISDKLTDENWSRIRVWRDQIESGTASMFTYTGEVFSYLNPTTFNKDDLNYANSVLRIFSGLYGILKPMDSIMPYRLDIKDSLKVPGYKSLYQYWKPKLTDYLIRELDLDDNRLIIDLSSKEYSKSVDLNNIDAEIITPDFKSEVNGSLKTVAIWSKRMRGLLTREILLSRAESLEDIKKIKLPGYRLEDTKNGNYLYIKE